MRVVEVGQYFVTTDTGDFRQLQSVACREYTLPRDDRASQPKGWIQGNMRIGPVLEVTTSFQHFKYGIEIRIWFVNQDNSHSWVRISYGSVKYVIDFVEDDTENLADPQEEEDVPTSSGVVAARSKAKAKPQPRESTGTTTIPLCERKWIDIEPSKQDLDSYDLSKKVINLLRHNQTLHREEHGAIEFCKIKSHLRNHHSQIQNWSDDRWQACLAAGGGIKRRFQYCSDNLGSIIYLRALQGHSGDNIIDLEMQDHVLIGPGIFPYIYHVGSNFNLYSIINNGLVPGGQNLSRRQTVFFLLVDPGNESHKDPEYIDFSVVPRLARCLHSAWKKHQDAVFWVDIDLAIKEGLTFYQTRSNAIILQGTLPAHGIVKVERLKTGEKLYEKPYLSPRPPPKISLQHDHNWTKGNDQSGSTVEHQPVGKLVQQSLGEALRAGSSKPTQFPKPIEDRTEKLVTQEIVAKSQGELGSSDRTGKPVKDEEKRVMNVHDRTGKPVEASTHTVQEVGSLEHRDTTSSNANKFNLATDDENIDFNISGVPNAMVKRSHGIHVHNLIQQIENHPQRQAFQSDLQQHQAFNPFSEESKDATMAAGNTELCEIVDVEPKSQCRACLTYWSAGIVYRTCGHLLEDDTTENKKYISSVLDLFSIPNFYIRKGRPHGHRYGKKGCKEYHTANQLQKKCRKKHYENIHDRFVRDTLFRKTMIELGPSEEIILEMDRLASEDHSHIATQEEIDVYRGNWLIHSNVVNFDTMPTRRQLDFKKALSTLHRLKKAEDKTHYDNWS